MRTARRFVRLPCHCPRAGPCGSADPQAVCIQQNTRRHETAALMLGTDKSRGYCLEMICADFLAGARLEDASPETLFTATQRLIRFLSARQKMRLFGDIKTA